MPTFLHCINVYCYISKTPQTLKNYTFDKILTLFLILIAVFVPRLSSLFEVKAQCVNYLTGIYWVTINYCFIQGDNLIYEYIVVGFNQKEITIGQKLEYKKRAEVPFFY